MKKNLIRELEMRIVDKLVQDALDAGYRISVSLEGGHDIEDMLLGVASKEMIMGEAFSGDECHLFIHANSGALTRDGGILCIGWVYLVLGNEGWDVISDYSAGLGQLLSGALEISNQYS